MRIPSSLRTAFAGVAAAIGVFVAGCGSSSSSPPASSAGQSCTRTADCAGGLVCISNTCFPSSASADSGVDLDGAAVDGAPSGPARPEELGQPCATTSNCGAGLTCVPFSSAIGGLCDYTNFGVNPDAGSTGKTCTGECSTAADCCELPPPTFTGSATFYDYSDSGVYLGSTNVYADQCSAVLQALGGSVAVCASPDASSPNDTAILHMCFYYQTYCGSGCAANWSCTNNACVYSGSCTLNAGSANPGSCPTYTRTGRVTGQNCIAANDAGGGAPGTPGSCSAAPTTCATNAECNGQTIADPSTLSFTGSTTCEGAIAPATRTSAISAARRTSTAREATPAKRPRVFASGPPRPVARATPTARPCPSWECRGTRRRSARAAPAPAPSPAARIMTAATPRAPSRVSARSAATCARPGSAQPSPAAPAVAPPTPTAAGSVEDRGT